MSEMDSSRLEGDDADVNYAAAYLEDDDQGDDDDDLAEMFAKVQSIQETEGRRPTLANNVSSRTDTAQTSAVLSDASPPQQAPPLLSVTATVEVSSRSRTPKSLSRSSSSTSVTSRPGKGDNRSADGIKTISRHSTRSGPVPKDVLLGTRKPQIFDEKILQLAMATDTLERLKQKAVTAPPARVTKRTETLAAPLKKDLGRRFATDDEERHCRFQAKKSAASKATDKNGYDHGDQDESNGSSAFIARMEAAERNRQKKLEVSRGEDEYNARLDKKCCPKCGVPQSYSEFHDKKKRCQTCGAEFRILQAWGDVGHEFITRMTDAVRSQTKKKEQIRVQVMAEETQGNRLVKTARQRFYEKQMTQKNSQRTFLDRNYTPSASSKVKQAELEIQARLGGTRTTR